MGDANWKDMAYSSLAGAEALRPRWSREGEGFVLQPHQVAAGQLAEGRGGVGFAVVCGQPVLGQVADHQNIDVIVISSEEKVMKPDPGIYHIALERLGVQPDEAVFVDDFQHNVEGAQALGMHAIRFVSTSQTLEDLGKLLDHE